MNEINWQTHSLDSKCKINLFCYVERYIQNELYYTCKNIYLKHSKRQCFLFLSLVCIIDWMLCEYYKILNHIQTYYTNIYIYDLSLLRLTNKNCTSIACKQNSSILLRAINRFGLILSRKQYISECFIHEYAIHNWWETLFVCNNINNVKCRETGKIPQLLRMCFYDCAEFSRTPPVWMKRKIFPKHFHHCCLLVHEKYGFVLLQDFR